MATAELLPLGTGTGSDLHRQIEIVANYSLYHRFSHVTGHAVGISTPFTFVVGLQLLTGTALFRDADTCSGRCVFDGCQTACTEACPR